MRKITFLLGAGIGFILGSLTGPYQQLVSKVREITRRPEVQDTVAQLRDTRRQAGRRHPSGPAVRARLRRKRKRLSTISWNRVCLPPRWSKRKTSYVDPACPNRLLVTRRRRSRTDNGSFDGGRGQPRHSRDRGGPPPIPTRSWELEALVVKM